MSDYKETFEDRLFWYRAQCVKVVDGDTIELLFDLGMSQYRKERVRIYGINTPEIFGVKKDSEEYAKGMEAKVFVEEFVNARDLESFIKKFMVGEDLLVQTIKDKTGKYGRYLANIFKFEGEVLVKMADGLLTNGLAEEKSY